MLTHLKGWKCLWSWLVCCSWLFCLCCICVYFIDVFSSSSFLSYFGPPCCISSFKWPPLVHIFSFFSYDFHIKVIFHLVMQFPPIHFLPVLGKNEQHGGIIPLRGYCFNKERFRTKQQVNKEKKYFFCKIDMKVLSVCHFYWIGPPGRFSVSAVLSGCCLCVPSQKTRFPGD